jgi:hypothetical protein
MSAPLSISANPDTSVSDSCNCASCCPVSCCMPMRGRRVRKAHAHPPVQTREVRSGSGDIEVHAETTLKVHNASQPTLNPDGSWEVMIDGKKFTNNDK